MSHFSEHHMAGAAFRASPLLMLLALTVAGCAGADAEEARPLPVPVALSAGQPAEEAGSRMPAELNPPDGSRRPTAPSSERTVAETPVIDHSRPGSAPVDPLAADVQPAGDSVPASTAEPLGYADLMEIFRRYRPAEDGSESSTKVTTAGSEPGPDRH